MIKACRAVFLFDDLAVRQFSGQPGAEPEFGENIGEPVMFKHIMVPVDLDHADKLDKALAAAADLSRLYSATVTVAGVVGTAPGKVAHNPAEYQVRMQDFAQAQSDKHGVEFKPLALTSHDPAVDLDTKLKQAAQETGTDLVVMASHVPSFRDRFFGSNAGYLASHMAISIFIIR
jgi:nucleotide-binding universal stress UspA family protein